MLQMVCDSELKRESYSRLNQGFVESMAAQWWWFQLKIGATSYNIFGANHIWFWRLGSQKSSASNRSQFRVETTKIWLIEARLRKGHAITGWSMGQFVFGLLGSFFGVHWVFLFSLTLSLVTRLSWQFGFYPSFSYQFATGSLRPWELFI